MRQGARSAAGLVAACALLAGCSGDTGDTATTLPPITGNPTEGPTSDASPSLSAPPASTTEPAPTTSAELPDEHVDSVETTMRNLLSALNQAKGSGDFSAFDALYTSTCVGCSELRDEVVTWLAEGQTVVGGDWTMMQQSSSLGNDGHRADVYFLMYRTSATVYRADGASLSTVPQSAIQFGSAGLVEASPWLVDGMGYQDLPQ